MRIRVIMAVIKTYSRTTKIVIGIVLACTNLLITPLAHAQVQCKDVFTKQTRPTVGDDKIDQVMDLLFYSEKRKIDKGNPDATNDYFQMVWESKAFADYLKSKNKLFPSQLSYSLKYKMLSEYILDFMVPYQQANLLHTRQKLALREALELRGIAVGDANPYTKLAENSSKNLLRLLGQNLEISSEYKSSKAYKVVENLELFFSHNSHIMQKAPGLPLLAPIEIEKIGLTEFGRSSNAFNRFIKSDEQVYFWAVFKKKTASLQSMTSEYGEFGVVINRAYARTHLWVSPFVMYEWQLIDSINAHAPLVADTLAQQIAARRESLAQYSTYNPVVGSKPEIRAAQAELGKLDFTPDDFEALIKKTLAIALQSLQKTDLEKYNNALKKLNSDSLDDINSTIRMLAFPIFKYQNRNGFEGKVPVAVPETELFHFSPE